MKPISNSILLLSLVVTSTASAAVIVDFTSIGGNTANNAGGFVFSAQDLNNTGVSFNITASAVIPAGGGANSVNSGNITRLNGGLGSTVENTGDFLNAIGGVSEVLRFTISNVTGLGAGQTIQVTSLLSQNSNGGNTANQAGGFGGTFGADAADSVTLTSDIPSTTVVIDQSDTGDLGAVLLNGNNSTATTGNTFEHLGTLEFNDFFDVSLTDNVNNAVVIQGFEFAVVPEPSTFGLLGLTVLGLGLRRRR